MRVRLRYDQNARRKVLHTEKEKHPCRTRICRKTRSSSSAAAGLRSHFPDGPVIAITSALFALQHFYRALMIVAFLYPIGAGWIRARTGSTLNTLVMHVLSDSLLLVLALVTIGVTPR
jgi:hypothetical protein